MTSNTFPGLVVLFVIVLDRLTKIFIIHCIHETESTAVIPGVFHITRVNNTGAAFGIFRHSQAVLVGISLFFIFVITVWFVKNRRLNSSLASTGWALVLGGASSNLFDRVRYGYVIDFLDFRVWPVFNVADMAICTGVFLVLLYSFADNKIKKV